MTRFTANLIAGITFIAFTWVVNATEPGEHSTTPKILSSINFSSYKALSNIEMAEAVGGVIPNDVYNITGSNPNGTSYTGSATISVLDQTKGVYSITYATSDNPQVSNGAAFEYSNALTVLSAPGTVSAPSTSKASIGTCILNSNGSLNGRRWRQPDLTFATETLTPKR